MLKLINDRDELYKRERRIKFELLVCRLVQFSETDLSQNLENVIEENLQDISEQWFFTGAEIEPNSSCLCGQGEVDGEKLKYVTYIRNRFTNHVARIGSSCIKKFGDGNPIKEEAELLSSLMKNYSLRVKPALAEFMAKHKVITQLELALIKELGQKIKLEQGAIDTLSVLKAKIAIEKIPPSIIDIVEWINDFVSKNRENPEFVSAYDNKKVVVSKRFIEEYRELREKLLIADASEYEKQTAIRILCEFYRHKLLETNITLEPSKERPELDKCQLDKFQVNQCDANQMIHVAEFKIKNYLDSKDKKDITREKDTYTVSSVLLDAYHRFNGVTYNIDLLDGIQESIARLELEIEKLPFTIKESLVEVEEKLKEELYQNINEMESDIKQSHNNVLQELQQVRDDLSHEVKSTINGSKKLLREVEAELKRLKKETDNLVADHTLSIQHLEESVWSTINSKNNQIDLIENSAKNNQSDIGNLESKIDDLEEITEINQSDIENSRRKIDGVETNLKAYFENLSQAIIGVTREELTQAKWIAVMVFLFICIIGFWLVDTRLNKLEREQQRIDPTLRQFP